MEEKKKKIEQEQQLEEVNGGSRPVIDWSDVANNMQRWSDHKGYIWKKINIDLNDYNYGRKKEKN